MSIKIMSEVWQFSNAQGLSRLILLAIADNCDDDGFCYPGIKYLAKKCRVSERTIQRATAELAEIGELKIHASAGIQTGFGNTNKYQVLRGVSDSHRVTTGQGGVTNSRERGDNLTPKPSVEPSDDKHQDRTAHAVRASGAVETVLDFGESDEGTRRPEKKGKALSPVHGPETAQQQMAFAMGRFLAVFPGWKYRKAPARDKTILTFMKRHYRDGLNNLLTLVHESDYLMARNGFEKGSDGLPRQAVDPSWIFQKDHRSGIQRTEKIFSGEYHNDKTLSWKPENRPVTFTADEMTEVWLTSANRSTKVAKKDVGPGGCRYWLSGKQVNGLQAVIDNGPDWSQAKFDEQSENYYRMHPEERPAVAA